MEGWINKLMYQSRDQYYYQHGAKNINTNLIKEQYF